MTPTFLGVPLSLYGIPCLLLAFAFLFAWPYKSAPDHGWRRLVLRWGHSIVWLLLGFAAFTGGTGGSNGLVIAKILAALALIVYVVFVIVLLGAVSGKNG